MLSLGSEDDVFVADEETDEGIISVGSDDDKSSEILIRFGGNDEIVRRKQFLIRLLSALHAAGNFSFRTELDVRQVAKVFDLSISCTVFPVTALVSFHESNQLNPNTTDSYTISINSGLNCSRLSLLEQLCFELCRSRLDFHAAEHKLASIERSQLHPWWVVAIAFAATSFSSTTLFFGGTWRDGAWSSLFGVVIFAIESMCGQLKGLTEIEYFVSSFVVGLISTALDQYVYGSDLCLFAQIFGGIVWLLPGVCVNRLYRPIVVMLIFTPACSRCSYNHSFTRNLFEVYSLRFLSADIWSFPSLTARIRYYNRLQRHVYLRPHAREL